MVHNGGTIQFSTCMIWEKTHTFGGANAQNFKVLGYCNGSTNAKTHVSSNVTFPFGWEDSPGLNLMGI